MTVHPHRKPWESSFPPVWLHAGESFVKTHHLYAGAKAGDADAAAQLIYETFSATVLAQLFQFVGPSAVLVPVHARESEGVNAIPVALARLLTAHPGWRINNGVVQTNIVSHTGATGFQRLARQALFEGEIEPGRMHVIVDDFVGQGGTIANLRGHILHQNGRVAAATVLTGKVYSRDLALQESAQHALRRRYGSIEQWWRARVGSGFDCLTASEARYLSRSPDEQAIVLGIENAAEATRR